MGNSILINVCPISMVWVFENQSLHITLKLTKEAEHPAHQWVEVTAVSSSHNLLWPVKLFGCVLDQEQDCLCYRDLRETKKVISKNLHCLLVRTAIIGIVICSQLVTQTRATKDLFLCFSLASISNSTVVECRRTYEREEVTSKAWDNKQNLHLYVYGSDAPLLCVSPQCCKLRYFWNFSPSVMSHKHKRNW